MGGGGVNMPPGTCPRFCCFEPFSPHKVGDGFFSRVSARKNPWRRQSPPAPLRPSVG